MWLVTAKARAGSVSLAKSCKVLHPVIAGCASEEKIMQVW